MPKSREAPDNDYKALTTINLPVIDKQFKPGDTISAADLEAAGQTEENIMALVNSGALGGEEDELHPSTIIPDPGMPTIQSVVAQAQQAVREMEARGEEIPAELNAVANLDYSHVTSGDKGASSDTN